MLSRLIRKQRAYMRRNFKNAFFETLSFYYVSPLIIASNFNVYLDQLDHGPSGHSRELYCCVVNPTLIRTPQRHVGSSIIDIFLTTVTSNKIKLQGANHSLLGYYC